MILFTDVRNASYVDKAHTKIDCEINSVKYGWVPYTLDPADTDTTIDNNKLLEMIGDNVAAWVKPSDIDGEEAISKVRAKRDNLLVTEVDPIATNAIRWSELTATQQTNIKKYRTALLNITTDFPDVTYVYNEETEQYEETNITWPTKPAVLN